MGFGVCIEIQRCELSVAFRGLAVLMYQASGGIDLNNDSSLDHSGILRGVVKDEHAYFGRRVHVRREHVLRTVGCHGAQRSVENFEWCRCWVIGKANL